MFYDEVMLPIKHWTCSVKVHGGQTQSWTEKNSTAGLEKKINPLTPEFI